MPRILIFSFLSFLSSMALAFDCSNILGNWVGSWENESHHLFQAVINIETADKNNFIGEYRLSDGSTGGLHGKCNAINENEIYITLKQDAPLNNPCRGLLLNWKDQSLLHFYCFNPNQSGYFTR